MGFFDLGLSDLFGAGMDLLGDRMQYSYDKRLMREQMKLNREQEKWSALKMPTFRRTGYENAGYNPLLAFSSNLGSAQGVGIPNFQSHLGSSSLQRMMEANTGREQMQNQKNYEEAVVKNQKAEVKNKEAQTKVLEAQAEETRLNNAETRRITEDRNKMSHVIDLLRQRIDYIRSGAGSTSSSIGFKLPFGLGHYNRDERRDNSSIDGVIHALDLMIQKYGGGAFDALDNDVQFDTFMGVPSQIERDNAKYMRDRSERHREEVLKMLDPRNKSLDEYYNNQRKLEKKRNKDERSRKSEQKKKDYRPPKPPPPQSFKTFTNLYDIPGMYLFR